MNSRSGQPAFIVEKPGNGFEMHFGTKYLNQQNKYELNYNYLHYKDDFMQILKDFKRLPFTSIRKSL